MLIAYLEKTEVSHQTEHKEQDVVIQQWTDIWMVWIFSSKLFISLSYMLSAYLDAFTPIRVILCFIVCLICSFGVHLGVIQYRNILLLARFDTVCFVVKAPAKPSKALNND